jgi:predicted cupin superfamily sugar epimerase
MLHPDPRHHKDAQGRHLYEEQRHKASGQHMFTSEDHRNTNPSSVMGDQDTSVTYEELLAKYQMKRHPASHLLYSKVSDHKENVSSAGSSSKAFYCMLHGNDIGFLHRVPSAMTIQFQSGKSLVIIELNKETKSYREVILGSHTEKGEVASHVIKPNTWWGCYLVNNTLHLPEIEKEEREMKDDHNVVIREKGDKVVEIAKPDSFQFCFFIKFLSEVVSGSMKDGSSGDVLGMTEVAHREQLIAEFPQAIDKINLLTHPR